MKKFPVENSFTQQRGIFLIRYVLYQGPRLNARKRDKYVFQGLER